MYPLFLYRPSTNHDEPSRAAVERYCVTCVFSILCIMFSEASWAAPIATNTALPLSADEIIVREQLAPAEMIFETSSRGIVSTNKVITDSPNEKIFWRDGATKRCSYLDPPSLPTLVMIM